MRYKVSRMMGSREYLHFSSKYFGVKGHSYVTGLFSDGHRNGHEVHNTKIGLPRRQKTTSASPRFGTRVSAALSSRDTGERRASLTTYYMFGSSVMDVLGSCLHVQHTLCLYVPSRPFYLLASSGICKERSRRNWHRCWSLN